MKQDTNMHVQTVFFNDANGQQYLKHFNLLKVYRQFFNKKSVYTFFVFIIIIIIIIDINIIIIIIAVICVH
jgi:hypothetical protein